jgi:hypothetical protein
MASSYRGCHVGEGGTTSFGFNFYLDILSFSPTDMDRN